MIGVGKKKPLPQARSCFPLGARSQFSQSHVLSGKHTDGISSDEPVGVSIQYTSYTNYMLTRDSKGRNNEPITMLISCGLQQFKEVQYTRK